MSLLQLMARRPFCSDLHANEAAVRAERHKALRHDGGNDV